MKRKQVIIISWIIICIITMISLTCFAKEDQGKTVRVAYTIEPGYQEGREGEYKTGYGYEYLQKLASINGWKYEYIYGSFNDLFTKLENGEVDIMGQLSYTKDRAEKISYGNNEQGRKSFYLYVKKNQSVIDPNDYSTINGKKIGVCAGKVQKNKWETWCENHNVESTIVEFDYLEECRAALNSGTIDGLIEGRIQVDEDTSDWEALIKIASASFYFGINQQRPDLLYELNSAQDEILEENPFYNEKVQDRYMKPVTSMSMTLSDKEKNWLNESGRTIRFGYLEGFPPLCYQDKDGTCKGVIADVFSSIEKQYAEENIKFEGIMYSDYYTMFDALRNGSISVAWPAYDDYWYAEQNGYAVTDTVVNTSMLLVYDGEYTDATIEKIGVINTGSLPKIYGNIHYQQSEIREYDSYESAINAVLEKEVGSVLYVSTTYNVDVLKNDDLQKLNMITLSETFGISFAVLPKDEMLISLLDKGIAVFEEAGVNHSLITNSIVDKEVTLKDYFEQHPYISALVLIMIAGIIIFVEYKNMSIRIKTSQAEKDVFERLSNSDPLTGLYNRKAVFNKAQELLRKYPDDQFVMCHVDMKHFRLYNTFFGDEAGGELLCAVADLFRKMSKDYDYWAYGRIEADVFCLFFPYDEMKYRKHFQGAMQFLKNYRTDFLIEPALGVYFVTNPEMPMEAMFTRATLAAKEVQTNTPYATLIYNEKLESELNEKQQIINDMKNAIDQEQFKVYLQPKYSLKTNKLVGAEALVRWIHPIKGMISPGKFIPVFEGNGFITILDRYMWEHVCQLLCKWKNEGKVLLPISVNISRLSMFGTSTVEYLKELVKKYDIDPRYLELELTETAYMDDPEEMKLQMMVLRDAGFTILLDDFGSGYSSLNTLRELPADILKLDMKFLSLDENDIRGGLVISSIVRMSKLLNLAVIAEGVELQEQADYLKSIGCEYVQGFLFACPMPIEDYERLQTGVTTPLKHVNQPMIDHIGRIIAETGSGTYAMGTVIPTPLACLEYKNQQFNFLRVNPAFLAEFCMYEDLEPIASVFKKQLSDNSYDELIQSFERSVHSEKEVRFPIIWNTNTGEQRDYICSVAYEGNIGETAILVVTFMNVTDMIKTGSAEIQTNYSLETEAKLWSCVKYLMSASNISEAMNVIILEVMNYYDADRAYIFEFDWEQYICTNTYEICAPNVEAMIDSLQKVPIEALNVWIKLFNKKSLIHIKDLNELIGNEDRKEEYDVLAPQGIQSLIAVPVYFERKLVGFFGVDNPKSHLDDTSFIESLAFFCVNESLRDKEKTDLEKMSMHDPLTGAYNRKAWEKEQKKLVRKNIPYSVVMIDVDNYKQVNDQFGHQTGDELLKKVVTTLNKLFRANDMVVRYGGDEFLVILENTGSWMEELLTQKIERLNAFLSQGEEQVPGVTVSVGIAFSDDCEPENLVKNADNALYYVKHNGKNGSHIYKGKQKF